MTVCKLVRIRRVVSAIIIIGAIVLIIITAKDAHCAGVFDSYSDNTYTVVCNDFTQHAQIVYMQATGLVKNKWHTCRVYDANNIQLASETAMSDNAGVWTGQIQPSMYESSAPGTWRADLYDWNNKLVCTDTFNVSAQCIPEFNGIAGVAVPVIALTTYVILSKRNVVSSPGNAGE